MPRGGPYHLAAVERIGQRVVTDNPFSGSDLQQSIELRWTLRDIKAKRWVLTPIDPAHLARLISMGLVEMGHDDRPSLTGPGLDAIS